MNPNIGFHQLAYTTHCVQQIDAVNCNVGNGQNAHNVPTLYTLSTVDYKTQTLHTADTGLQLKPSPPLLDRLVHGVLTATWLTSNGRLG